MEQSRKRHTWDSYVGILRGTLTWESYVGLLRGTLTWDSYMGLLHGTHMMWSIEYLGSYVMKVVLVLVTPRWCDRSLIEPFIYIYHCWQKKVIQSRWLPTGEKDSTLSDTSTILSHTLIMSTKRQCKLEGSWQFHEPALPSVPSVMSDTLISTLQTPPTSLLEPLSRRCKLCRKQPSNWWTVCWWRKRYNVRS